MTDRTTGDADVAMLLLDSDDDVAVLMAWPRWRRDVDVHVTVTTTLKES